MIKCNECGTENIDGLLFCENCGSELVESDIVEENLEEQQNIMPLTGAEAKLILLKTGEEISLPDKEEIIIGREDPVGAIFPDIDTTIYGGEEEGVSRKHVKISHVDDEYFVEDLNSVNSTFLNKSKLEPESPVQLNNGDELMLGRLKFNVTLS